MVMDLYTQTITDAFNREDPAVQGYSSFHSNQVEGVTMTTTMQDGEKKQAVIMEPMKCWKCGGYSHMAWSPNCPKKQGKKEVQRDRKIT